MKQKSGNKTSLYEIRLKNVDHDVVVLKGSLHLAADTYLSGKIVLSVTEPISVRKITLRLVATLRLKYPDPASAKSPPPHKMVRFERKLYEYQWDSNEFSKYLSNMYDNSNGHSTAIHGEASSPASMSKSNSMKGSTTSLKNLGLSFRSKSSTSLSSHLHALTQSSSTSLAPSLSTSGLSAKSTHVLVLGNYEFPFSAILPGTMPESVEGLPGASVTYKLQSTLERGKFHAAMTTSKHVRVVRTMTTDAVELSETVAVDNTWPNKVEYSLSVPSKAIAIGSGTPISFMLVPLLKGLRLGEIKISLVELYLCIGYIPPSLSSERVVAEKVIPPPPDSDDYPMDRWEITSFLKVPHSLSQCTQDCDILTHIKVRHKLKFVIGLVNPDGHVSELRASLPVLLFISPFVSIRARADDNGTDLESLDLVPHDDADNGEELLFASDPNNVSHTSLDALAQVEDGLRSNHSHSSFTGLVAPPVYERHIYDQLWSDISPMDSPATSGSATPRSVYGRALNDVSQFSMSSIDTAALTENLRQLSIQRQAQESHEVSQALSAASLRGRATFNLDGGEDNDYFSARPRLAARTLSTFAGVAPPTPGAMSPPIHLLRAPSETSLSMSRVPSYGEAMKSSVDGVLSPAYMPPAAGSGVDIEEANKRYGEVLRPTTPVVGSVGRQKLFLSRGSSSFNLLGSNNSSPSNSRNQSTSNLSHYFTDASHAASKRG